MNDEFEEWTIKDLIKDRIVTADGGPYQFRDTSAPNSITCMAGGVEMFKVNDKGFWVRGVKVEQGAGEAQAVYEGFKAWMAWAQLSKDYK